MGKRKNVMRLLMLNLALLLLFSSATVALAGVSGVQFPLFIGNIYATAESRPFYVDTAGEFTFRVRHESRAGADWFRVYDAGNNRINPISVTVVTDEGWMQTHDFVFSLQSGQHTLVYDGGGVSTGATLRMFQGSPPTGFPVNVTMQGRGSTWANVDFAGAWPGETVVLNAISRVIYGYNFSHWEVTSGGVTPSNANSPIATFIMPSNAVEVRAVFVRDANALTLNVTSNNDAWGSAWASDVWDNSVGMTASPMLNHLFVGWREISSYGITLTPNQWNPYSVSFPWPPPGNVVFEAEFRPMVNPRNVTVAINNTDWGRAFASTERQEPGQSVRLSAWPMVDWVDGQNVYYGEFVRWEVISPMGLVIEDINAEQTSFIMPNADVSLRAVFREAGSETWIPVTAITNVPATAVAGVPLALFGTPTPTNATNRAITWSVVNAGTTGAVISGNTLLASAAGTVNVAATITNGATATTPFTQTFAINVTSPLHTITFNANGGTVHPTQGFTAANGRLSSLPTPTRNNYTFVGWFTSPTGGTEVTTNTFFASNATIFARWTRNQATQAQQPAATQTQQPTATETAQQTNVSAIGQTTSAGITLNESAINNLVAQSSAFELATEGATVSIPYTALASLANAAALHGISVELSVTPLGGGAGRFQTIQVNIAEGNAAVSGIPLTITTSLDASNLAGLNTNRIVALCPEGNIVGGAFNPATGEFVFESETAGEFTIAYVPTLNRLVLYMYSPIIHDHAGNSPLQVMDVLPVVADGRTLIPVRFMAYALGAEIDWTRATDYRPLTVYLTVGGDTLSFGVGETTPTLTAMGMDVPAQLLDGRTMVPLRFISEFFGALVNWDGENRRIEIIR